MRPNVAGIVDERREEVQREDERTLVVELVDGGVVCRRQTDEQVLGLGRDESLEQLLETSGRVLRGAATADRQTRERRRRTHLHHCTETAAEAADSWGEEGPEDGTLGGLFAVEEA